MRPRVSTSVPVLVLLLAAVAAIRCAASPAWPPPEEVSLSDEDFLLDDPYTGHFRSRFWYFNAALVDGTDLTLSLFQWRYGLLGRQGLLVLSKEPDGETYALETKLEGLEVASRPAALPVQRQRPGGRPGGDAHPPAATGFLLRPGPAQPAQSLETR